MYNMFEKRGEIGLLCAMPDGRAMPPFLRGEGWAYRGKVEEFLGDLFEIDRPGADILVRENGYFVYGAD